MYNSLVIKASYLAEVQFGTAAPSNGQRIYFLDIPQLRDVKTVGLEAFCSNEMTYAPSGNTMGASLRGVVFTFAVKSTEEFVQWPGYSLEASQNGGLIREIDRKVINLPKSYITVIDSTLYSASESLCINFYYLPQ